jgi:EAL domain-containing protein (putative c-di-GMP-specific phosphodiesterase class I)
VSPRFLKEPPFLGAVTGALAASGLDPSLLQLELTESALMENSDVTVQPLIELYTKGVHVSLDDFGTGYSSLIYLRRYPISSLKLDETLVRNIASDAGDAAIASGLIALAHSLDMKVIVEGVETAEQLAFFRAKHCDEVQGFFLSAPLDREDFFQLLKDGHDLDSLLSRRAAAAHG